MGVDAIRFFPLGESAITVEFGNIISAPLNDRAIALAESIGRSPFPGFVEAVPAYCSATVFYDLVEVRRNFPDFATAFDAVRYHLVDAVKDLRAAERPFVDPVEVPVDFGEVAALDLAFVAEINSLTPASVVEIFTSQIYRVYMLGFLPGFTYMGEVDERIAAPRKETPRMAVPRGSVGIAGRQTGIYSLSSPGGWQIIGRTDLEMFTPGEASPSALKAGDLVRFVAI